MKHLLILTIAVFITALARAEEQKQESATPAEQSQVAQPNGEQVKTEPAKKEAVIEQTEVKPAAEAAAPVQEKKITEETKAEEVKPIEKPVKKEMAKKKMEVKEEVKKSRTGCATCFQPLVEGYEGVLADLNKWIDDVNDQTYAAEQQITALQKEVKENETAITQAKLEGGKAGKDKIKELSRQNKQIWASHENALKQKTALCKKFASEAGQKVKAYQAIIAGKLKEAQTATQRED